MSGRIRNFQLVCESRQTVLPSRGRKKEGNRSLLREINVLKIFTRMAKTNSSQQESRETKESDRKEEEPFFVVSKVKNTALIVPIENLTKNFKLHRQRIKTFASEFNFKNQSSEKNIQNYGRRSQLKIAKSTQKMETQNIATIQSEINSQIMITKKALISYEAQAKQKYSATREVETRPLPVSTNKRQSKQLSTDKIHERKHPILASNAPELKSIKSQSYIVVEYPSQRTIISHRATLAGEIASLTKIMTFYTVIHIAVLKKVDIKNTIVRVTHHVSSMTGTTAELMEGEEYTVEQLLYGLMLPSGNDAANQLAIWGGSLLVDSGKGESACELAFVSEMNKLARGMGLKHTQFGNPHGLPSQCAKSNATDIAKLCCKCMKNPHFRRIVSCKDYKIAVKSPKGTRVVEWENTNKLLRREGFIGLKTGITATAGPCLAAAYNFRGKTYISVVLRAPKISSRFKQTRHLLFWTLSHLFRDLSQEEYIQLRALKRENYDLDSDYSEEEEEFKYGTHSRTEHQRRCNILDEEL